MSTQFDDAVTSAVVEVMIGPYFMDPPTSVFEVELGETQTGAWSLQSVMKDLEQLVTVDGVLRDGHKLDVKVGYTS